MKLGDIFRQLLNELTEAGIDQDEARSMTRLWLAHDKNCTAAALINLFADEDDISRFLPGLARLKQGEPLQYLLGEAEFMGLTLSVCPDVLIPRGDSEPVVEAAIALLKGLPAAFVADICSGSGAFALALAAHLPRIQVLGTDISAAALLQARQNARRLNLQDRVSFQAGDLCQPHAEQGLCFDMIIANPPYISRAEMETLPRNVRREPKLALFGGEDGLDLLRRLCAEAPPLLKPGGYLLLEHDFRQGAAVRALLRDAGLSEIRCIHDYGGRERAALGRRS